MSNRDTAGAILEATDILINKRLEGIKFDTTDVGTIVDDKSAKTGKYIVSTGSVSYVAYSTDTTYKNGDCVYVTIPNGDYDNQKIISGKKVSSSEQPYVYVAPFDTIIDVTGNLFDGDSSKQWGLVANLPSVVPNHPDLSNRINIWTRNFTKENLIGFTRLGIQAQFMSWLNTWQTIYGNYGLELTINYEVSDSGNITQQYDNILSHLSEFTASNDQIEQKKIWENYIINNSLELESIKNINNSNHDPYTYAELTVNAQTTQRIFIAIQNEIINRKNLINGPSYLVFDCSRFQGDPYNFSTYYQQEMVFDISYLKDISAKITSLSLDFYEEPSDPTKPEEGYPKKGFKGLDNSLRKDKDGNNEDLPYGDIPYTTGNDIFNNIISPNLWVKDVYVCLGYDLGSITQDTVNLYTISSPTYLDIKGDEKNENTSLRKELSVRWVHDFGGKDFKEIYGSNVTNLNYEIRWYRYKMGASAPDNYAGVFWERINVGGTQVFDYVVDLDVSLNLERFKVIVLLFDERLTKDSTYESMFVSKCESNVLEFMNEREVVNTTTQMAIDGYSLYCIDESQGNYFVYGQNQTIKDQVEAAEIRQLQCYFKDPVAKTQPSVITKARYITWRFPAENTMLRLAESFNPEYTEQNSIKVQMENATHVERWPGADQITTWIMAPAFSIRRPGAEKIINLNRDSDTYLTKNSNGEKYNGDGSQSNDGGVTTYQIQYSGMYYEESSKQYVFAYKGSPGTQFINPALEYRIADTYYQDRVSNTVICEIQTDDGTYIVSKTFQFGPSGTNGSKYTLLINFDHANNDEDNKYIITANDEEKISIYAEILGPGGHAADLSTNPSFIWEWGEGTFIPKASNNLPPLDPKTQLNNANWLDSNNSEVIVHLTQPSNTDQQSHVNGLNSGPMITLEHGISTKLLDALLYIKCTVRGLEPYDLVTVEPIAVRSTDEYEKRVGPTIVAYHPDGEVDFLNEKFTLAYKSGNMVTEDGETHLIAGYDVPLTEIEWEIYNPNQIVGNYMAEISSDGELKPSQMYVDGMSQYGVRCKVVGSNSASYIYTQPIFTCQNRYASGALNNWNGKELVIDYDNGLIMANAISAGKKNSDNTFSGVVMGDWSDPDLDTNHSISEQTGLYGFDHGAMSYALKEDGTAFIGKAGMGRLVFDGNNSTIKSAAYQVNHTGMKIDLDDSIIDMIGSVKVPQYNGYFEIADDVISSSTFNAQKNKLYKREKQNGTDEDGVSYEYYIFEKVKNNDTYDSVNTKYYYYISNENNSDPTLKNGTGGAVVQNAYAPTGARVTIKANDPYLEVKTAKADLLQDIDVVGDTPAETQGNTILKVGHNEYFLQSDNFSANGASNGGPTGSKIDLVSGNVILAGSVTWSEDSSNKPYQVLYSRGVRHQAYVLADDINSFNFATNKDNLYIKPADITDIQNPDSEGMSIIARQLGVPGQYLFTLINNGTITLESYIKIHNNATFESHIDYYRQGSGLNKYYYTTPLNSPTDGTAGYQALPSDPPAPTNWHSNFTNYNSITDSVDPYGSDNYYSVSYDTGEHWSEPQAINGHFGSTNLMAGLLNNESVDGIYNNGSDIGIRAAAIRTGFLYSREGNLLSTDNTFNKIREKVNFTLDLDEGRIDLHDDNNTNFLRINTSQSDDGMRLGDGAIWIKGNGDIVWGNGSSTNNNYQAWKNQRIQTLYSRGLVDYGYTVNEEIRSAEDIPSDNSTIGEFQAVYYKDGNNFVRASSYNALITYYTKRSSSTYYSYSSPGKPNTENYMEPSDGWVLNETNATGSVRKNIGNNYPQWHRLYNTNDKYVSYSYNQGQDWSSPSPINGNISDSNILAALLNTQTTDGIYNNGGNIGIRASTIRTGLLYSRDANLLSSDNTFAKIAQKAGAVLDLDQGRFSLGKGNFFLVPEGMSTVYTNNNFNSTSASSNAYLINGNKGDWVIYLNGNFGVDINGHVHATAGTIGSWNIGSKYLASNVTDNYTATSWLFSVDQSGSDGAPYYRTVTVKINTNDDEASYSDWRILVGRSSTANDATYKFGIRKNGYVYASKMYLPKNALVIDGEQVTVEDVTIPVAFKAVAVEGYEYEKQTGSYVDNVYNIVTAAANQNPYYFSEYGSIIMFRNSVSSGYTGTVWVSAPVGYESGGTFYYGANGGYVNLGSTFQTYTTLQDLAGSYFPMPNVNVSLSYEYYGPKSTSTILGYKTYITKVAKAKLLFSGTNGIVTESLITSNNPDGYLLTSGDNVYGLINDGELWEPDPDTNTFKMLQIGAVKEKTVFIENEIDIGDYNY